MYLTMQLTTSLLSGKKNLTKIGGSNLDSCNSLETAAAALRRRRRSLRRRRRSYGGGDCPVAAAASNNGGGGLRGATAAFLRWQQPMSSKLFKLVVVQLILDRITFMKKVLYNYKTFHK